MNNPDPSTLPIEELREVIRYHDRRYYIQAKPEIGDREYDAYYTQLKKLEAENPALVTPDSPTQRMHGAPLESFKTVAHQVPMLSLDNTYSSEDIRRFYEYIIKGLNHETPRFTVEPKVDGVSISILYEKGLLTRALTRGNGKEGDDVTANIRTIPSVPLRLNTSHPPDIFEIRGEVYMSKEGFSQLNAHRLASGQEEFANARNATAGSIKMLDSSEVAKRPLDIVFYAQGVLSPECPVHSQTDLFNICNSYGLKTQKWLKVVCDLEGVMEGIQELEIEKPKFPYEIDGAVIKVDSFVQREKLGMTAKAPSWAKAYKYEPERAITRLNAITIQVGRTGVLTPVAELEPVFLSGSTISRATLHNEDEIKRKDIRIGDMVQIEKAGEVIPAVIKVLTKDRSENSEPFDFVKHLGNRCPSCGESITRDPKFAAWRCENINCPAQNVRRIEYFAARNAMDLEALGSVVAEALVEHGLIQEPLDLFRLTIDQLAKLNLGSEDAPRIYGAKNGEKLLHALERAKTMPLSNWLQAIGIPNIGAATAYQIGQAHKDLTDVAHSTPLRALLDLLDRQNALPGNRLKEEAPINSDFSNDDALFAAMTATKPQQWPYVKLVQYLKSIKWIRSGSKKGEYVTTGVGYKAAQSVLDFFQDDIGKTWLKNLEKLQINPKGGTALTANRNSESEAPTANAQKLTGMTFVLTGTLHQTDRETASAKIRSLGGKTTTSVSRNTTYLVAGENTGQRKTEKALELNVKIINEKEFFKLLEE